MIAPDELDERTLHEQLLRIKQARLYRACRSDLTSWTIEALRDQELVPARHHRLILDHLMRVYRGEIKRLMIFCPPGSAKSTYASMLFPPWCYEKRERLNLIGASHVSSLAEDFSREVQSYIRQQPGILRYGLESENVQRWRTTNRGLYRAAGVGGSITGRRAHGVIIDDPVKGDAEAESPTIREATWRWYQAELYTRLVPGAWIILIMTRWHEDDLGGRLLKAASAGADHWTVLKLPAICDTLDDPLDRQVGEALWPEWQDEIALLGGTRENGEIVAGVRANVGEHVWGALYQQDPKPRGAAFFDIDHFLVDVELPDGSMTKGPIPMPKKCGAVYALVDTAIKSGQEHNSTAVTYFAYDPLWLPRLAIIIDWDIVQIEGADQADWLPSVFQRCEELAQECGARQGSSGAFIEDKATGTVLLQQGRNAGWPTHPIDSKLTAMGKEERAIATAPYVIAGGVKIAEPAFDKTKVLKGHSANHQIKQLTDFRLGAKQKDGLDLLDTLCYGVLITHGTAAGERKGI